MDMLRHCTTLLLLAQQWWQSLARGQLFREAHKTNGHLAWCYGHLEGSQLYFVTCADAIVVDGQLMVGYAGRSNMESTGQVWFASS